MDPQDATLSPKVHRAILLSESLCSLVGIAFIWLLLGYTKHQDQACVPGAQEMSTVTMHTLQEGAGSGHFTQHTGFLACGRCTAVPRPTL